MLRKVLWTTISSVLRVVAMQAAARAAARAWRVATGEAPPTKKQ